MFQVSQYPGLSEADRPLSQTCGWCKEVGKIPHPISASGCYFRDSGLRREQGWHSGSSGATGETVPSGNELTPKKPCPIVVERCPKLESQLLPLPVVWPAEAPPSCPHCMDIGGWSKAHKGVVCKKRGILGMYFRSWKLREGFSKNAGA